LLDSNKSTNLTTTTKNHFELMFIYCMIHMILRYNIIYMKRLKKIVVGRIIIDKNLKNVCSKKEEEESLKDEVVEVRG